jgi:predicted nucleic acid-binding Zn ribbon protein
MSLRKYTNQSLKTIIDEMLKNSHMDRRYSELEVARCYNEVVGEVIARKTVEIKVRNKTLVVKLDSGPLKEELAHMKRKIIGLVNEKMGSAVLEEMEVW